MSEHDCHECGHSHDCSEMNNIIELKGENGEVINVEYLATLKMKDDQYAIMRSLEDDEDNGEVIIMKIEEHGEESYLISIDNEEELNQVFEAFKNVASEQFDFE